MTRVVQRTPNLGLSIRLQPLAADADLLPLRPAPDPDPDPDPDPVSGCEVSGVAWGTLPTTIGPYQTYSPIVYSTDGGATNWRLDPRSVYGSTPVTSTVVGIPSGASIDGVRWEWAWMAGEPIVPVSITASPQLLVVSVPPIDLANDYKYSSWSLSAQAFCGDTLVGTLTLQLFISET